MDYHIDTLATRNHWTQGSPTRPFTGIVRLFMADQLSAETAAREIVSVVNEVYYNSESALVEDNLLDLWRAIVHTARILPRCICSALHPLTPNPDPPSASPQTTPLQRKLLTLLHLLAKTPNTDPIPSTLLPTTKDDSANTNASDSDSDGGYGYRYHPSLSPYLGSTVFSPFPRPHASSSYLSANPKPMRRTLHPDPETKIRHKRGIIWSALPFFGAVVGEAFLDSPGGVFCYYHPACPSHHPHHDPDPYPYPDDPEDRELILTGFSPPETEAWMNLMNFLALMGAEGIWTGPAIEDVAGGVLGGTIEKGFSLIPPPAPSSSSSLPSSSSSQCGAGAAPAAAAPAGGGESNIPLNGTRVTQPPGTLNTAASTNMNEDPTLRKAIIDLGVACAGIWGVVFGEELWRRRGEGKLGVNRDLVVGISLDTSAAEREADGRLGRELAIPRDRWELWIGRLRGFSEMRGLRVETRQVAAEAAGAMEGALNATG
ncbi:hypothetical protein BO71DRAFT_436463 [Aspergillus ellipticus CBS 707.79]|uniref:Uncharacterized protein n=1 Tax=Aspergillus ellipticus CBS 707.79 TaxID=1448320 RepID=A0A319CR47_9EURO|nr:hypothetical protein BO71DRAFT_436463 [Aspergillus ellipticus CBS 707.79]